MRGLDEQEREALTLAKVMSCSMQRCGPFGYGHGYTEALRRLLARGLVRMNDEDCQIDPTNAHCRPTPLGQRILELDRIAREGGLGL
jgi:hypothetical protein